MDEPAGDGIVGGSEVASATVVTWCPRVADRGIGAIGVALASSLASSKSCHTIPAISEIETSSSREPSIIESSSIVRRQSRIPFTELMKSSVFSSSSGPRTGHSRRLVSYAWVRPLYRDPFEATQMAMKFATLPLWPSSRTVS